MDPGELLVAVRDAPDEDGPLTAYATWLEGQGDPFGEFIRVHTRLGDARLGARERAELAERERALRAAHEEGWLAPLGAAIDDFVWWRGMLGVDTSVAKFLAHAEALVGSRVVRFVDISDWSAQVSRDDWRRLAECPLLRWVTMLGVRGRYCYDTGGELLGDAEAEVLAGSQHTARLFRLDLNFNAIGDRGVAALAASPNLSGLTELTLRGGLYGDAGLAALARARFTGLRTLDLAYCDGAPGPAGWAALLTSQQLPRLYDLCLAGNEIPPELLHTAQLGGRLRLDDAP